MTLPALIIASLIALVALPVVSQISGSSTRSTGIHGSKDPAARGSERDDGTSSRT